MIPFEVSALCDCCGAVGAYDYIGSYLCAQCTLKAAERYDQSYVGQIQKFNAAVDDLKETIMATGLGKALLRIMDFEVRLIELWNRVMARLLHSRR